MIATLILGCVLSGAAGFLAGWWKGRQDHSADMQGDLDKLCDVVAGIRTECVACGADYEAMCPKGCAAPAPGVAMCGGNCGRKAQGAWGHPWCGAPACHPNNTDAPGVAKE